MALADADYDDDTVCVLELNPLYAVVSSTVSFYLPCLAMLCIYYRLHRYARRQVESIKMTYKYAPPPQLARPGPATGAAKTKTTSVAVSDDRCCNSTDGTGVATATASTTASAAAAGGGDRSPLRYKMSDHKAAITLGIIMGVFLLSWGPFFTVNLVGALFGPGSVPPLVFGVFTWLGYCNSTMNPVIYSIFNRQFRDAFSRVLAQARRRIICCSGDWNSNSSSSAGCCCCCCCCTGPEAAGGGPKYGAVLPTAGGSAMPPLSATLSRSPNGFIAGGGVRKPQTLAVDVSPSVGSGERRTRATAGRFAPIESLRTTSL